DVDQRFWRNTSEKFIAFASSRRLPAEIVWHEQSSKARHPTRNFDDLFRILGACVASLEFGVMSEEIGKQIRYLKHPYMSAVREIRHVYNHIQRQVRIRNARFALSNFAVVIIERVGPSWRF